MHDARGFAPNTTTTMMTLTTTLTTALTELFSFRSHFCFFIVFPLSEIISAAISAARRHHA